MRQRPGRFEALYAAIDARRFENADQNRKRPWAVDFLEVDHLLIVDLADDDPGQFHRDGHGGLSLGVFAGTGPTLTLYSPNYERRVASYASRSARGSHLAERD